MLFNQSSPPWPADPVHIGPHTASILTPADKADTRIGTAFAALSVFWQGYVVNFSWWRRIAAGFFLLRFCVYIHSSAPFRQQKRRCLFR
jgi:hypothetical protein